MQVLPNENILVGYGYNAAFTEFASNGVALCETHFGATSRLHTGDVQSYRVMKFNWTGLPRTNPDIALVNGSLYVSWNGATEVRNWVLETGDKSAMVKDREGVRWRAFSKTKKNGFETRIEIPSDRGSYVRVVGVDGNGKSLGATRMIKLKNASAHPTQIYSTQRFILIHWAQASSSITVTIEYSWQDAKSSTIMRFLGFCVSMICFGITFSWLVYLLRRWCKDGRNEEYDRLPMEDV